MDVILLENIRNVGKLGSKVDVAKGYGRNYLIPQGKAIPATKKNIEEFEVRRAELEKASQDRLGQSQARAAEINTLVLNIQAKAGEEGKLFGSVGTIELVKAMKDQGVTVDRQEIRLPNGPLRELGEYQIEVQLHPEVVAQCKVIVTPEKDK